MMNGKLSQYRIWPYHENGLIRTIQMIPNSYTLKFQIEDTTRLKKISMAQKRIRNIYSFTL